MNWFGSGMITILLYASAGEIITEQKALLTEINQDILTENSNEILEDTLS